MGRWVVVVEHEHQSFTDAKGRQHTVPARTTSMEFGYAFMAKEYQTKAKRERGAKITLVDREDEWDEAGLALLERLAKLKVG